MSNRKVAIITGISKGYGRVVARRLAEEGWVVVGDARSASDLDTATKGCDDIVGVPGDIRDEGHLRELIRVASEHGIIELLVNNAGILGPTPLPPVLKLAPEDMSELFAVNTIAQIRLIQLVFETGAPPAVINLSSDAAHEAYEGWGGYGASKAALDHFTSVLALEVPTSKFYSLDPGDMRTDMHQSAFPDDDITDRPLPDTAAHAVSTLSQALLASGRYSASDLSSVG